MMPKATIALVKESNRKLVSFASGNVVARASNLPRETISDLMKKAFERLGR
jgi:hypothetical protein